MAAGPATWKRAHAACFLLDRCHRGFDRMASPGDVCSGMQSAAWHMVGGFFLATGLLFWWPVVRPWPSVSKPDLSIILYLFLATLPCDILSGFLVFCDRVVYPAYFSSSHAFGFSALGDQQCAGALMWTCVTIVYLVAGTILTMRLLSPQKTHEGEPCATGIARQRSAAKTSTKRRGYLNLALADCYSVGS